MPVRRARSLLAASLSLVSLGLGGCATMRESREPREASSCNTGIARVRNDLGQSVEIYGYVGNTKRFIGYVSGGSNKEFDLSMFGTERVGYLFAELDGRRVSTQRSPRGQSVHIDRSCPRSAASE